MTFATQHTAAEVALTMAAKRLTSADAAAMLELQLMFRAFDTDDSGEIDRSELQGMMKQLLGNSGNLEELDEMMTEADRDGDGGIGIQEFCVMMGAAPNILSAVTARKEKRRAQKATPLRIANDGTVDNWRKPRKEGYYVQRALENGINRCDRREQMRRRDMSRRAKLNFASSDLIQRCNGGILGVHSGSGTSTGHTSPKYMSRLHQELTDELVTKPRCVSRGASRKGCRTVPPAKRHLLPPADCPLPHLQRPHTSLSASARGFSSPALPSSPWQTHKHVRATVSYQGPSTYIANRVTKSLHSSIALPKRPLSCNGPPDLRPRPRVCQPVRNMPSQPDGPPRGQAAKGHPLSVRLCNKCKGWFESLDHLTRHLMTCSGVPAHRKQRVAARDRKISCAIKVEERAANKIQATFRMMLSADRVRVMEMDRKDAVKKLQRWWKKGILKNQLRMTVAKAASMFRAASTRPSVSAFLHNTDDKTKDQGVLWSLLYHCIKMRAEWKLWELPILRGPQQWNKQYRTAVQRYQAYESKFPGGRRFSTVPQEVMTSKQTDYAIMDVSFDEETPDDLII